jgi:dsDNA-specific endonuclease/ATPase MutS2
MDESDPEDEIEIPIEDSIDLHAYAPKDIPDVVVSYLAEAVEHGFTEVRLIHGKGIGMQRERIRKLLETSPYVEDFGDAPPGRGHWGATIVHLRPRGGE